MYKKNKKTSTRLRPESEWIKITSVPTILDPELFERVQKQLKSNSELCIRGTKNEYLLSHRIWCPCGQRRAGEGPKQGKHLYYRCTRRVKSFPLPSTCHEKGLNARIVDKLVWQKIADLMSSPALLVKQAERWLNNQSKESKGSTINIDETRKEITKQKDQEGRYAKAYGAGVITMEQLKEYTVPIKDRIAALENQIVKAQSEIQQSGIAVLPKEKDLEAFSQKAREQLVNLKFEAKQGIVRELVDKIVATREQVRVYGFIPLTNINVLPSYRYRRAPKRR